MLIIKIDDSEEAKGFGLTWGKEGTENGQGVPNYKELVYEINSIVFNWLKSEPRAEIK